MAPLLACCAFVTGRKKNKKVHCEKEDSDFTPKCSCATFKSTGKCRHLPPPITDLDLAQAPKEASPRTAPNAATNALQARNKLPELDVPRLRSEEIGKVLTLGKRIGKGASGATVFQCQVSAEAVEGLATPDNSSGAVPCAAKVLPYAKETFSDMVEDLAKEMEMLKTLARHPHLVGFMGAWHVQGWSSLDDALGSDEACVLCMELCHGSLEDVLSKRHQRQQHFSTGELLHVLSQASKGLAFLHGLGVMHRDLKSANVFLLHTDREEELPISDVPIELLQAKIGDFGSAKAASRAGTPVQTPQYMAPEVARRTALEEADQGELYGLASDIWAFGCVIHELLNLGIPYGEDLTIPQLEEVLLSGKGPSLLDRQGAEERSQNLVSLMDSCLKKDPCERPTAAELEESLLRELESSVIRPLDILANRQEQVIDPTVTDQV